jgi:hypothetical protein
LQRPADYEPAMRRGLIIASILVLSSCAQPFEGRVASRLHAAGLPRGMSECMAKRWVDRLTVFQLRKIQSLTEDISRDKHQGRLTVIGFVERVRRVNDPEIFNVVSKSAAVCALRG